MKDIDDMIGRCDKMEELVCAAAMRIVEIPRIVNSDNLSAEERARRLVGTVQWIQELGLQTRHEIAHLRAELSELSDRTHRP